MIFQFRAPEVWALATEKVAPPRRSQGETKPAEAYGDRQWVEQRLASTCRQSSQRAQYSLIGEYSLNDMWISSRICGILLD